jgi:hypothetical protein
MDLKKFFNSVLKFSSKYNKKIVYVDGKGDLLKQRVRELKGCDNLVSVLHPEWCMPLLIECENKKMKEKINKGEVVTIFDGKGDNTIKNELNKFLKDIR